MVVERPRLAEEVVVAASVAEAVVLVAVAVPKPKAGAVEATLLVGAAALKAWVVEPKDKVGAEVVTAATFVPSEGCVETLPKPNPPDTVVAGAVVAGAAVVPKFKVLAVVVMANGVVELVATAAEFPRPKEKPVVDAVVPGVAVGADGLNEKLLVVVAGAGVVPKENPEEEVWPLVAAEVPNEKPPVAGAALEVVAGAAAGVPPKEKPPVLGAPPRFPNEKPDIV